MLLNKGLSIAKHRLMLDLLAVFKSHLKFLLAHQLLK
jgi:hypothetical protein